MNMQDFLTPKNQPMSKSDEKIYASLKKYPSHMQLMTIQKIAADAQTSVASVQRYCKKLGFQGFKDFQFEFRNFLNQQSKGSNTQSNYLDNYFGAVKEFKNIDSNLINCFINDLLNAPITYSMGIYYSGLPAKQLSLALRDLNRLSFSASDYITASHWTRLVNKDDAFVVFSISGDEADLNKYLSESLKKTNKTYLITFNNDTALKKYFEHVIVLPGRTIIYNSSMDPQSLVLLFVEMIIDTAIKLKINS